MPDPENDSNDERPASYWKKGSRWILLFSIIWIILALRAFSIGHAANGALWLLVWFVTLVAALNWYMKSRKISNKNSGSSENGDTDV